MKPTFQIGDVVEVISVENCSINSDVIGSVGTIRWIDKGFDNPMDFMNDAYAIAFPEGVPGTWDCNRLLQPGEAGFFVKFDCVRLVESSSNAEIDVDDYI